MSNFGEKRIDVLFRLDEQARRLRQIKSISTAFTKIGHEPVLFDRQHKTRAFSFMMRVDIHFLIIADVPVFAFSSPQKT